MDEYDLSQLSEAEINDIYSDIVESGQEILIAKSCPYGYTPDGVEYADSKSCERVGGGAYTWVCTRGTFCR